MKHKTLLSFALSSMLTLSAIPSTVLAETPSADSSTQPPVQETSGCKGHKAEETAEPENAIGKDAAKAAALKDAGINESDAGKVRARVSTMDDGTVIYKVKFTASNIRYSYKINATSGEIVEKSNKEVTQDSTEQKHSSHTHTETAEPENAIGKDAAKAAALKDAGINESDAGKVRARVSTMDDGTVIYKVKFTVNNIRYSYKINATSGEIVEKSNKEASDDTAMKKPSHTASTADEASAA